jgi:Flp pilus assembly protein TadB
LSIDVRLLIAIGSGLGMCLLVAGLMDWRRQRSKRLRFRALSSQWSETGSEAPPPPSSGGLTRRGLAGRVGARVGVRFPGQVDSLLVKVERAGLGGRLLTLEMLGWKALGIGAGAALGMLALARFGSPGLVVVVVGGVTGWFVIDVMLARRYAQRRKAIQHDLPTVMDLLVLSLEAGMGLDRAMRTVAREFHSVLSDELGRVLSDLDLGLGRGAAFERMAARVGLEDLQTISRAIVQSEELGVSLVGVMQNQGREVRIARRRAAEAEALRTPIKMLIPLVVFILPTLFMLILGPVGLRAGAAFAGGGTP